VYMHRFGSKDNAMPACTTRAPLRAVFVSRNDADNAGAASVYMYLYS